MKKLFILLITLSSLTGFAQNNQQKPGDIDLITKFKNNQLTIVNREVKIGQQLGKDYIEFLLNVDEGLAWIDGVDFKTGTIELDLKGQDVFQHSFLGIAFHGVDDTTFEAIYFRPFQFRTADTIRQKRAVQYISLPDYTWSKLRETNAGKFENSVTPAPDPNDWFHARVIITDHEAMVFVNNQSSPCMIVPLLGDKSGKIGLYAADRSGGSFANLRINGPIPHRRAHHAVVYDESVKSVLLYGGSTPLSDGQYKFFNDMWKYDMNGWKNTGNKGDERSGMRLAFNAKNNKIYSYGGYTSLNKSNGQLRVFENGDWKILTDLSEMKSSEGGFVYDSGRDHFIAFGGSSSRGVLNGITWEWDGTVWKKFIGESPAARQGFVMVYDNQSNKTILYGGIDGNGKIFDDGIWEFDGLQWKNIKNSLMPSPRMMPGYAYDSKRGLLIIFGGADSKGNLEDTWSWNGEEWKKLADQGPSSRVMGWMAYDKHRDRIVLFGGRLGATGDADDTWEWDGNKWIKIDGPR